MGSVEEVARQVSSDGSREVPAALPDGVTVECVGMPAEALAVCAPALQAEMRHGLRLLCHRRRWPHALSSAEIYRQVMRVRAIDFNTRVTSVVLMGRARPFMNYDATLGACASSTT